MSLAPDMGVPTVSVMLTVSGLLVGTVFVTDGVQSLNGTMLHAAAVGFVMGYVTMASITVLYARQYALDTGGSR